MKDEESVGLEGKEGTGLGGLWDEGFLKWGLVDGGMFMGPPCPEFTLNNEISGVHTAAFGRRKKKKKKM